MSLADLIRKRPRDSATAIPAIPATQSTPKAETVARIATVAVASTQKANGDADPLPDSASEARRQRAELARLIDRLAERTGQFSEADKVEALEVALRDPCAWLEYLPFLLERSAATVH